MSCRETLRFSNAYLDGELDLAGTLAIEEHLQTCSRCRAFHAGQKALQSALRRNAEFRAAPESLRNRLKAQYGIRRTQRVTASRWLRIAVPAFAVMVLALWTSFAWLGEPGKGVAPHPTKIVYHISNSDTASTALRNLGNHLDASPGVRVVVVAHNDGVDFLLRGARDESGRLYEEAVKAFNRRGVEFRICNNTLVRRQVGSDAVIPEATLVPSGIAEIGRLQSEEGYAYMRL